MAFALTRKQSRFWVVQRFEHIGYLGIRAGFSLVSHKLVI